MSSRNIIEGLGKFDGKRHRPITPFAGSWADQEAKRPRTPITPEQERQRRAGIVHPSIANAVPLKGYERTDARGVPLDKEADDLLVREARTTGRAAPRAALRGDSQFRRPSYGHIDPFAGTQRKQPQQTDDMGLPVGPSGMRRFATSAPDADGSTSGILLGKAGYRDWARDMHERGEKVPAWDEGAPYGVESLSPSEIVDRLLEGSRQSYATGNRVQVSGGSGIDSDKTGVIVDRSVVKTDGRGIATNIQGHYKPVDWGREAAVQLDDGSLITMFKNRLLPVAHDFYPPGGKVRLQSGARHDPEVIASLKAKGADVDDLEPRA